MSKTVFIKNAAVMTATALVLRLAGIIFKVWLAASIGSEGIGLYQMVFSVYVLVATFATSGICTAVTRLCTDELAVGTKRGALRVLKKGIVLSTVISLLTLAATFFGADFIAESILSDVRAASAIQILGFSLPFMGISSCIRGYFIARRKAFSPSFSQIIDQAVRIVLVITLVGKFASKGLAYSCAAVLAGDTVAEILSCLFLYISFRIDQKKLQKGNGPILRGTFRKILHIAVPITAGRYLNSALRTAENILVPASLTKFTLSRGDSLSQFGMIKGMALPLLFFPSSFLSSVSTLLIPEMSEASAKGQHYKIKYAAEKVVTLTSVSSFFLAALFFCLSEPIGLLIYKSTEVGWLLRALAPIVPLMYIDSVADGMLKGLDEQSFLFRIMVSDSALRIILIVLFVPHFGMKGFLGIMVISNLLTAVLRVKKLLKLAGLKFLTVKWIIKPLACAVLSVFPTTLFTQRVINGNLATVLAVSLVSCVLYIIFTVKCRCVCRDDLGGIF